jgi:hypothetical protein
MLTKAAAYAPSDPNRTAAVPIRLRHSVGECRLLTMRSSKPTAVIRLQCVVVPRLTPAAVVQPAALVWSGLAWFRAGGLGSGLAVLIVASLLKIGTVLLPRQDYGQSDVRWSAGAPHNESTRRRTHVVWDGPGSLAVLVL